MSNVETCKQAFESNHLVYLYLKTRLLILIPIKPDGASKARESLCKSVKSV